MGGAELMGGAITTGGATMYAVIGYWGGNRVVVAQCETLAEAIAAWLGTAHTGIWRGEQLVPLVRTGPATYRFTV
jgi:hypothetical protein